jgi:hypothetical protein
MESSLQNKRSEGRSNVFLGAVLEWHEASIPARIRNISSRGALVDAPSFPNVGTAVRLVRGELSVTGELAWVGGGLGGINFGGRIEVESWVRRTGASGQQRVDGVVDAIRHSRRVPANSGEERSPSIAALSAELDELCERFAETPDMTIAFGENLLKLDSIAQALRRLATGRPVRGP